VRLHRIALWTGATLLALAVVAIVAIVAIIQLDLRRISNGALERFPGDRTEALISMVDCESCRLKDRNLAVWALGQMEAEPALEALRLHFDGTECAHSTRLCQYEIGKAIRKIETRRERSAIPWQWLRPLHQP
jgi:hypothetical protein